MSGRIRRRHREHSNSPPPPFLVSIWGIGSTCCDWTSCMIIHGKSVYVLASLIRYFAWGRVWCSTPNMHHIANFCEQILHSIKGRRAPFSKKSEKKGEADRLAQCPGKHYPPIRGMQTRSRVLGRAWKNDGRYLHTCGSPRARTPAASRVYPAPSVFFLWAWLCLPLRWEYGDWWWASFSSKATNI